MRVRLRNTLPLADGLAFAASFLSDEGRPLASFAACELRSPSALSMADFIVFNSLYSDLLRANGFGAENSFPVARSNMAPLFDRPATHTLFAFTYAMRSGGISGTEEHDFVISGMPEITTAKPGGIVAGGDTSPAGMTTKARHVIAELQFRVESLGGRWSDITGVQAYTLQSLDPVMEVLGTSGLATKGLALFPGSPPVIGFDFEIDVRAVSFERVVF
ncbi:MAG: hypothetical protein JO023_27210 [Chloroflexi bacterium]|nr:hypothetical protein [Chloroflexota bacterium]